MEPLQLLLSLLLIKNLQSLQARTSFTRFLLISSSEYIQLTEVKLIFITQQGVTCPHFQQSLTQVLRKAQILFVTCRRFVIVRISDNVHAFHRSTIPQIQLFIIFIIFCWKICTFYSILFYSILFYSVLSYSTLFYSNLFYSILFYSTLLYYILFYSILFCQ